MSSFVAARDINHERGFLPSQDPLQQLPQVFDPWESFARSLPKQLASDHVRRSIQHLPEFPLGDLHNDRERERAMVLLSYLGHAAVAGYEEGCAILVGISR
jgi:indoleamine 2,3-dioxygenase